MVQCIYCKKDSSSSSNAAHVIPEGVMENPIVLPMGFECDDCNRKAGKLEHALVHNPRIAGPIVIMKIPGKNGKIRKQLGHFKRSENDNRIEIIGNIIHEELTGEHYARQYDNHRSHKLQFYRRALFHVAFNYMAFLKGYEHMLENRYDKIRKYIKSPQKNETVPYCQVEYPNDQMREKVSITWLRQGPGVTVKLSLFLDDYYLDLLDTGHLFEWVKRHDTRVQML